MVKLEGFAQIYSAPNLFSPSLDLFDDLEWIFGAVRNVDVQVADTNFLVDLDALSYSSLVAREAGEIDVFVGHRRHGLFAFAAEEEILNGDGFVDVAVALEEVVVEVLVAGAHATYVETDVVTHPFAGGINSGAAAEGDRAAGVRPEALAMQPSTLKASLSV